MKFTTSLLASVVLMALSGNAQTNVTFLNTGQMYVGARTPSTGVSLYIPDAMRHLTVSGRTVELIQNGITELGGNFYHDATTHVFPVDVSTTTTNCTGTFRFVGSHPGVNRVITTQSVNQSSFDRGSYYIAFPGVQIGTNDSIVIPGKMGIDAASIHKSGGKTGKFILRSEVIGAKSFDASLRIPTAGTSAGLVDVGTVVVERDMTTYRPSNGSTQLFAFATPFKNTQLSGYFAGNWLRRPLADGTYNHTTYIYGNKDNNPADGTIDDDQYVYLAAQKLVPAQAYFVKPRPKDYSYDQLKSSAGLWYTGAPNPTAYDKGKFYFNGAVYSVTPYSEQLFADDQLFNSSISNSNLSSTVNWLIGNSYTCPISINLLKQAMTNSTLVFSPYIYVYPAGSATYQTVDISGNADAIQLTQIEEIPAMSVFMVRVSKGQAQSGSLTIGKSMLRHASVAHNNPQKTKSTSDAVTNQVVFRVAPSDNDNIYDLTAIGLRADASIGSDAYDMAKAFVNDDNIFQLYTLSSSQLKLSANGLPLTADSITMGFSPSKYGGTYTLTSQYAESLTTEGLWIYDRKVLNYYDLKSGTYTFNSDATDDVNRFMITFRRPVATSLNDFTSAIRLYYSTNQIRISGLEASDLGGLLKIYDAQGRQLISTIINSYPAKSIPVGHISAGVYMVQITGKRCVLSKMVID